MEVLGWGAAARFGDVTHCLVWLRLSDKIAAKQSATIVYKGRKLWQRICVEWELKFPDNVNIFAGSMDGYNE